ncbi:MAG TPA: phosphonate C-P lyase system protein PhnG [Rhizobacter sp.]|jgi:alpha-D-ribose 1-methylphosphonate 5-triphosphate synthase subunit PhnG|nr:phosphonate C-P lyase system protein PhnG [Rhizobacter sp.]
MTDPTPAAATAARQAWLATLAHAPRAALARRAEGMVAGHHFDWLREPETGLALVRARIANRGDRFNLGEVTLTRCIARVTVAGQATAGVGHVLGRDEQRARWVAQLDALLQQPTLQQRLLAEVIAPLQAEREAALAQEQARHAASRVSFYTLQSEIA